MTEKISQLDQNDLLAPGFRMNEREANPNPYVGFIRQLKGKADHTDAEMILKAVAAQMKKIMEQRFMFVHTLEEAEFNRVFAGRNWNHGQSIELVLRGPSGRFLPVSYITSVMCHEMAHIEHMNHGPKFQQLMRDIKEDVRAMQARGYYGDGFWSDGRRLKDSVKMGAEGLKPSDFPEYVCGVTAGDARKAKRPRRGPRASAAPDLVQGEASHLSGRQTEYRRKAGRKNNVDMGSSVGRLDGKRTITKEDEDRRKEEIDSTANDLIMGGMEEKKARAKAARDWKKDNPWYTEGNTRGKVAKSKTAAELRAAAAEARLAAGKQEPRSPVKKEEFGTSEDEGDSEDDVPDPHIDPSARKQKMEEEMSDDEIQGLRGGWEEFFPSLRRKRSAHESGSDFLMDVKRPAIKPKPAFGKSMVEAEKKKQLGLTYTSNAQSVQTIGERMVPSSIGHAPDLAGENSGWSCKVCTFSNIADHGRCDMCGARPDGEMPEDIA